jgi:hypothetical protein
MAEKLIIIHVVLDNMSVTGLCVICDRPAVEHSCDRCGQLVCNRHWDNQRRICTECSGETGRGPIDPLPDGVDTAQF